MRRLMRTLKLLVVPKTELYWRVLRRTETNQPKVQRQKAGDQYRPDSMKAEYLKGHQAIAIGGCRPLGGLAN
jgi:hypothetical protein